MKTIKYFYQVFPPSSNHHFYSNILGKSRYIYHSDLTQTTMGPLSPTTTTARGPTTTRRTEPRGTETEMELPHNTPNLPASAALSADSSGACLAIRSTQPVISTAHQQLINFSPMIKMHCDFQIVFPLTFRDYNSALFFGFNKSGVCTLMWWHRREPGPGED